MKKIYCKDCKFNQGWRDYCSPFVPVGIRIPDYYSSNHLIRKKELGIHLKEEKNAKNDCNWYKRKWWKFFANKGDKGL